MTSDGSKINRIVVKPEYGMGFPGNMIKQVQETGQDVTIQAVNVADVTVKTDKTAVNVSRTDITVSAITTVVVPPNYSKGIPVNMSDPYKIS